MNIYIYKQIFTACQWGHDLEIYRECEEDSLEYGQEEWDYWWCSGVPSTGIA